jgi:hypothetical protein
VLAATVAIAVFLPRRHILQSAWPSGS